MGNGPTAADGHGLERGLQSFGEFGTLLGIVFVDTQKLAPSFHHWEQTPPEWSPSTTTRWQSQTRTTR